jgi:hypothetical protein
MQLERLFKLSSGSIEGSDHSRRSWSLLSPQSGRELIGLTSIAKRGHEPLPSSPTCSSNQISAGLQAELLLPPRWSVLTVSIWPRLTACYRLFPFPSDLQVPIAQKQAAAHPPEDPCQASRLAVLAFGIHPRKLMQP